MEDPKLNESCYIICASISLLAVAPTHKEACLIAPLIKLPGFWLGLRLITMVLSHFGQNLFLGMS